MSEEQYSIHIWECTFHKVDYEGNPLCNKDGTVKLLTAPNRDCSSIAESVGHDDLEESEDEL